MSDKSESETVDTYLVLWSTWPQNIEKQCQVTFWKITTALQIKAEVQIYSVLIYTRHSNEKFILPCNSKTNVWSKIYCGGNSFIENLTFLEILILTGRIRQLKESACDILLYLWFDHIATRVKTSRQMINSIYFANLREHSWNYEYICEIRDIFAKLGIYSRNYEYIREIKDIFLK